MALRNHNNRDALRPLKFMVAFFGLMLLGGLVLLGSLVFEQKQAGPVTCAGATVSVPGMRAVEAAASEKGRLILSVSLVSGSQVLVLDPCSGDVKSRVTLTP